MPLIVDQRKVTRAWATRLRRQDNTILNKNECVYNNRNERTKHTRTDNSYVNFGYDNLGQLTNALAYLSGGSPITNEQLGYGYDGGWNMTQRTVNGSPTSYTVNDRNQVTSISGVGSATFDANGNIISRVYDSNGPRVYYYVYDDENRLIEMRTDTYYTSEAARFKMEWVYDGLGRVRVRTDYNWYAPYGLWSMVENVRYLYDGRRVIQERNSGNTPTVTYTRGPDLSGSFEGAGGIGDLLARSHGYSSGNWTTHNFYHADNGGNITSMVNNHASAGAVVASYQYDPFGRTLSQSGTMAAGNVYRFSSKAIHPNSGLYGYGFRFYDPTLQRWLNRDPIFEAGGINLYGFVANNPMMFVDPFGEKWYDWGWIDSAANFCAGAADDLTFGLTDRLRGGLGWNDNVDKDSGAYAGGEYTAAAAGMFTPAGAGKNMAKAGAKRAAKAAEAATDAAKRAKEVKKEVKRVRNAENAINKAKDIQKAQARNPADINRITKSEQNMRKLLRDIANDLSCELEP